MTNQKDGGGGQLRMCIMGGGGYLGGFNENK